MIRVGGLLGFEVSLGARKSIELSKALMLRRSEKGFRRIGFHIFLS